MPQFRQSYEVPAMRPIMNVVICTLIVMLSACDNKTAVSPETKSSDNSKVSSGTEPDHVQPSRRDAAEPTPPSVAQRPELAATTPARNGLIVDPNDIDVLMIYYDWIGQTPPFAKWAEQESKVSTADEFRKEKNASDVVNSLSSTFASVKGTGILRVNISSQLSEYDPTYGEYYIESFSPGHSPFFSKYGEHITVDFRNAADAYAWKISAADARKVLDRNEGRSITVVAELKLRAARPSGDDGGILIADILRYTIHSGGLHGRGVLGSVEVPQRP